MPAPAAHAPAAYGKVNGPRPAPEGERQVLISLPHTEDVDADIQRMQRLHTILKSHRGPDHLTLLVRDGRAVTRLEPLERVTYSDEFREQVEQLLGEGSVQVREA
jgi:hypothetical protein